MPGARLPPKEIVSSLSGWNEIERDDIRSQWLAPEKTKASKSGLRSFVAEISHTKKHPSTFAVKLEATISICADFPRVPARAALKWRVPPARIAAGVRGPPSALRSLARVEALQVAEFHKRDACDNDLLHMQVLAAVCLLLIAYDVLPTTCYPLFAITWRCLPTIP